MKQENNKNNLFNEMADIFQPSHWATSEGNSKKFSAKLLKAAIITAGISLLAVLLIVLLAGVGSPENGGTYINNQYGFSLEFPVSWSNKFIVEDGFDTVLVRSRKIALFCGEDYGLLFKLNIAASQGEGALLGMGDGFFVTYETAENADLGNADEELKDEYATLLASLPEVLSKDAFAVMDVRVPEEVTICFTEEKVNKLFALLGSTDNESVKTLCKRLPFGKLLDQCVLDESTKTLRLAYPSKAVSAYNGLLVGDISRSIARCLFGLLDNVDDIIIDFDAQNLIGYKREGANAEMLVSARRDSDAAAFSELLCGSPERDRVRGFGKVERSAVVKDNVEVLEEPNSKAGVKFSLDAMAPVEVKAFAGEYCWIEWRCTEDFTSQGYILFDKLSFADEDIARSSYGYCESGVLYKEDGTTVLDAAFRGWFKILEEDDDLLLIEDQSGRTGALTRAEAVRDVAPWGIQLSLADLVRVYALGISQAYYMDISLNGGAESLLLSPDFGIGLSDELKRKLLTDVTEMTKVNSEWYTQSKPDSLSFTLDDKASEYTRETVLLRITKSRGANSASVDTLIKYSQGQWTVTRTVIVEAK